MTPPQHPSRGEIAALAMMEPTADFQGEWGDRARFEAHAAECASCDNEWRRAAKLASLMGMLAVPPPASSQSLARTQARVHALLASEVAAPKSEGALAGRGVRAAAAVMVPVVAALAMSGPSISGSRLLLALTTVGVAALLPGFAMRSITGARVATAFALALSFVLAFVDYSVIPMITGHAVGCMRAELAIAALPLVSMLAFSRRSGAAVGTWQTAAAGACGALAGQGVLLTTCAADESVLHVLVFHVAGVALAALAGGGLGRLVARGT